MHLPRLGARAAFSLYKACKSSPAIGFVQTEIQLVDTKTAKTFIALHLHTEYVPKILQGQPDPAQSS